MKNQYFSPRTLPKPCAIFPELPGSATELPGVAQKLSGGPSGGPAPARAESGQPQNWSPARNFQNTSFKRGFSEEININNHRPKSFLSLMEDAHKVLAANRKVIPSAPCQARWRARRSAALWIRRARPCACTWRIEPHTLTYIYIYISIAIYIYIYSYSYLYL